MLDLENWLSGVRACVCLCVDVWVCVVTKPPLISPSCPIFQTPLRGKVCVLEGKEKGEGEQEEEKGGEDH